MVVGQLVLGGVAKPGKLEFLENLVHLELVVIEGDGMKMLHCSRGTRQQ